MNQLTTKAELAKEYIEQLQRQQLQAKFGPTFEDKLDRRNSGMEEEFESIERYLEKKRYTEDDKLECEAFMKNGYFEERFTKFETVTDRQILNWLCGTYKELNPDKEIELPYISTIATNEITALIDKPEGFDKPYILFTQEQLHACYLLARMFVMTLPMRRTEGEENFFFEVGINRIRKHIEDNKNVKFLIVDFFSHSFDQRPGKSVVAFFTDEFLENMGITFLTSMELFIFSHEMGHFVHGDPFSTEGLTKEEMWKQESLCDVHALNQVVKLYHKMGKNEFFLLGPAIYLSYLSVLEMQNKHLAADETHPSAMKRLDDYCVLIFNFLDEGEESTRLREKLHLVFTVFEVYRQLLFENNKTSNK